MLEFKVTNFHVKKLRNWCTNKMDSLNQQITKIGHQNSRIRK